jgi:hypothetical protein
MKDRAAKRRKLNESQSTPFDENVVNNVVKYMNMNDILRASQVSQLWNQVCSDKSLWLSFVKQVGIDVTNKDVTVKALHRCIDLKYHLRNKALYDEFKSDPDKCSDLSVIRSAAAFVTNEAYKEHVDFDKTIVVFGSNRYKTVHPCDGTDSDSFSQHSIVNFTLFNPENLNYVAFRSKLFLQDDHDYSGEDPCRGVFETIAVLYNENEDDKCIDLFKFNHYDTGNESEEKSDLMVLSFNKDVIVKFDQSGMESVQKLLGLKDKETLTDMIVKCISAPTNIVYKYYNSYSSKDSELPEYLKQKNDIESYLNKNQLIEDMKSGKELFYEHGKTKPIWMEKDGEDKRLQEVLELAQKSSNIIIHFNKAGIVPEISECFDIKVSFDLSNSNNSIHCEFNSEGWGDGKGRKEELEQSLTVGEDGDICEISMESIEFDKSVCESIMKKLGLKHMKTIDFCDYLIAQFGISMWYSRVDDKLKYKFSIEGLNKWSEEQVPNIDKYDLMKV